MIHKRIQKRVKHTTNKAIKNVKELSRWGKIFFDKPILKFFIFIIIQILLVAIEGYFPKSSVFRASVNMINILIFIYFIAVVIFLIKRWYQRLFNPKNLVTLIFTYILFIIAILVLFSTIYNFTELWGYGYLKYGQCSDSFSSSMIQTDPFVSKEFFYFSSITFFTVGYGDICPMGFAKNIAILNAFVGHLVSVVIVVLILNNYIRRREEVDEVEQWDEQ